MEFFGPLLIAFFLVFLSELGDKTQLLILSFSARLKTVTILLGIALGSLFSHGVAILFGSFLGSLDNVFLQTSLQFITYLSFILLGVFIIFFKSNMINNSNSDVSKPVGFISKLKFNYILVIAISICIGEIGDKTFLTSLGLGINYPEQKLSLISGAILGMVCSNCIAIFLGKFLSHKLNENVIDKLSGVLFIVFGLFGLIFL